MDLNLTNLELQVLRELLDADFSKLLLEIARTDHRKMREDLKVKEELLKSIMEKLGMSVRGAA